MMSSRTVAGLFAMFTGTYAGITVLNFLEKKKKAFDRALSLSGVNYPKLEIFA